tara:strand:+ start:3766 stop:4140 length:375 start_codon:yes stop_codon:yes gene_type:complete
MPEKKWGRRLHCSDDACEAKFYDLNRKPPTCPICGAEYEEPEKLAASTLSKQVFTDNLNVSNDNNLVGSDHTESVAEVEDIAIDDDAMEDTISLEDSEDSVDVDVIDEEVDDLGIEENTENIHD